MINETITNLANETAAIITKDCSSISNAPWYIIAPWALGALLIYIFFGYLTFKWAEAYDWSYESQTLFATIWPVGATLLLISTIISLLALPIKISDMQYDLEAIKEKLKKNKK